MDVFKTIPEYLNALNIPHDSDVRDIFIFKIEDYVHLMPKQMAPCRRDFFQITYGRGHNMNIKVNNTQYTPVESMLSFTTPYHLKSWKVHTINPDSVSYMVMFKPDFIDSSYGGLSLFKDYSFFNMNTRPVISLSGKETDVIENLMCNLLEEFEERRTTGSTTILSAYLSILLEKTNRMFQHTDAKIVFPSRKEEITFRFENLVKEKVNYRLHLEDYAEMLHISKSYLSEAIKVSTGKTAKAIASDILVLHAKALLRQNQGTLAAIAEQLGFEDSSNFIAFFKKNVGCTPNQFRKAP